MADLHQPKEFSSDDTSAIFSSVSSPHVKWPFSNSPFWSKIESILAEPIIDPISLANVIQEIWKAKHPHGTRTGAPHR
jgi:hypothetical protein